MPMTLEQALLESSIQYKFNEHLACAKRLSEALRVLEETRIALETDEEFAPASSRLLSRVRVQLRKAQTEATRFIQNNGMTVHAAAKLEREEELTEARKGYQAKKGRTRGLYGIYRKTAYDP